MLPDGFHIVSYHLRVFLKTTWENAIFGIPREDFPGPCGASRNHGLKACFGQSHEWDRLGFPREEHVRQQHPQEAAANARRSAVRSADEHVFASDLTRVISSSCD